MASPTDNALADRILSDLNSTLDRPDFIEFSVITTNETQRCNKSPVIVVDNKLALESWCLKLLISNSSKALLKNKNLWIKNEQFSSLSNHSRLLVLLNPDHTTAWNVRRILVSEEYLDPWSELKLNTLAMTTKPKSDSLFTYRQWLIEYLKKFKFQQLNDSIIEEEFRFCSLAYGQHGRNYYAWTYAIWLTSNFCHHRHDVLLSQLNHSKKWIESHISDYSCFHYRQLLLDCFCSITSMPIIEDVPASFNDRICESMSNLSGRPSLSLEDIMLISCSRISMLMTEIDWLDELNSIYPMRESFLLHHRFTLSSLKYLLQEKNALSSSIWRSIISREKTFLIRLKDGSMVDEVAEITVLRYMEAIAKIEPAIFK